MVNHNLQVLSESFQTNGFVKVEKALTASQLDLVTNYYWFMMTNQHLSRFPTSLGKYGDFLSESLMVQYQKIIEKIVGKKLYPNFSFMRLYYHNSDLAKHCDRVGCEYAVSLAIDYDSDEIWPLHLEDLHKQHHALLLDRGDMAIYKGCELAHWRETYHGKHALQMFFFYVDINGSMQKHKFDGRPRLGDPFPEKEENK